MTNSTFKFENNPALGDKSFGFVIAPTAGFSIFEGSEMNLCECGCGSPVSIAKYDRKLWGWIKGKPKRFIHGHNQRNKRSHRWKGGKAKASGGRSLIWCPDHPRSVGGYVYRSVLLAEKALGRFLSPSHPVHHADGNHTNDKKNNLVICEDKKYHSLLHMRKRAYDASGNHDWRHCVYCKQYDNPENLYIYPHRETAQHRACQRAYVKKRKEGASSAV